MDDERLVTGSFINYFVWPSENDYGHFYENIMFMWTLIFVGKNKNMSVLIILFLFVKIE